MARSMESGVLGRALGELPDPLPIPLIERSFDVTIQPPGSKSLTNRALLLAALADGRSVLRGALIDADDARRMIEALRTLGAQIESDDAGTLKIEGVAGRWRPAALRPDGALLQLDLGNAGTATRFLAAAALLFPPGRVGGGGSGVVIDGNTRMRQRPIGELGDALTTLGARIEYLGGRGYPPMRVEPPAELARLNNQVHFGCTASSQFISALMLIGAWLPRGLTIRFDDEVTSESYISMTLGMLTRLGVPVTNALPNKVTILPLIRGEGSAGSLDERTPPIGPVGFEYDIEPDASGATYFLAAAALAPPGTVGRVRIPGLMSPRDSLQGDSMFADVLWRMGALVEVERSGTIVRGGSGSLKGIQVNMSDMPDAAMSLAAVACFASGPTRMDGLRTLRVKETDRIAAMQCELAKVGARIEVLSGDGDESVVVHPIPTEIAQSATPARVEFDTYDDHRMAMSLALIGLRRANVCIRNPRCVDKTYPGFWTDLARLYG